MLVRYPGLTFVGLAGITTGIVIAAGAFGILYRFTDPAQAWDALRIGTANPSAAADAVVVNVSFARVALFMMLVGFLASVGPARRAFRIHPTEALREP